MRIVLFLFCFSFLAACGHKTDLKLPSAVVVKPPQGEVIKPLPTAGEERVGKPYNRVPDSFDYPVNR
jgi:predicted small lipoprotein YifL